MFEKMLGWIRTTIFKLMGKENTELTISPKMETLIDLWARMYCADAKGQPLQLPVLISSEFARLVTVESQITITGSVRADWLQTQITPFLNNLRAYVEYACALGGAVFKPYVSGDGILIDMVQEDCFSPTAFDSSKRMTGAIFTEQILRKGKIYTRAESHEFVQGKETVQNLAFSSSTNTSLGTQVTLSIVPEWAELAPDIEISGIDRPLFAYFRIPLANNKDRSSPLGVSVFANAAGSIQDANEQYGWLRWEYDGGQLAIDVAAQALRPRADGTVGLDKRGQRLYRRSIETGATSGDFYHAFAPALRDASYQAGLDNLLKKIEFQCHLAFGTFSDPASVEKTATEFKISKQRSYTAVRDIQKSLETAISDLVYAMDRLATLYHLAPEGDYELSCQWHDSVLQDEETLRMIDRDDALNGFIPKWQYNKRWRSMTEDEAKQAVQEAQTETSSIPSLIFGEDDA